MALERLLRGFADFRLGYYREHLDLFEKLATKGQSPKILIIACADADYDYLSTWTSIAQDTRDLVVRELEGRPREEVTRAVEQASVINSVRNLMTFRWIAERVEAGTLVLHAWWFNLTEGQLHAFDPASARFEPVLGVESEATVRRGTALSSIMPDRFVAAVAGKAPEF